MNRFFKARLELTFWYCVILAVVLIIFSSILYSAQSRDFFRIVIEQEFGNRVPKDLSEDDKKFLLEQVNALRWSFSFTLLMTNGMILILGGGLSYKLAGKTLQPIQKVLNEQKEFVANASHELKTPLSAIMVTLEVFERRKNKKLADYKRTLGHVSQESQRLYKLVANLLTLSRLESNIVPAEPKKIDLAQVAMEVSSTLDTLAHAKKIKLIKKLEKTIVTGDNEQLRQLISILVENAIKYTEAGNVTVITSAKPKPTLIVEDTGIGIKKQLQQNIFGRFYRVDEARISGGFGLGLAIAREIIANHKAKVELKSAPSKGTTFRIIFAE